MRCFRLWWKLLTNFMPISKKLEKFLKDHDINYDLLQHKTVYTAFDAAQTLKKKLSQIAKTLAMKADKKYVFIVVPASHRINIDKMKKKLGVKDLKIVKEKEMQKLAEGKKKSVTPFGKFHNVPVYVDKSLLKSKLIIASTGSYTESILMKAKDLLETGAEVVENFAKEHKFKKPKAQKKNKATGGKKKQSVIKKKASVKKKTTIKKKSAVKKKVVVKKKPLVKKKK